MITGKEDLLQSLIEAFLLEKGTQSIYDEAAGKAVNDDARKTFQELAAWETEHMDFIQHLYQSLLGEQELESFEEFKKRAEAPITESGIPVRELEDKLEKYVHTDESGALNFALKMEGKAYAFYHHLAENAADPNVRIVFSEMVEQEVKHIDHLKKLKKRLA